MSESTRRKFLALVTLVVMLVAACGGGGGDDGSGGDIEVEASDGWQPVTMPALGFGLAVPDSWEAIVLSERGLSVLEQADPDVPDFALSALAAHEAGAVFYAAGRDSEDEAQVNDLKVLADTSSDVNDLAGLEDYAAEMVTATGLEDASITPLEDAPHPTVDVRFQATAPLRPEAEDAEEDGEVTVEGVQRVVLAPVGAVYVFIVTGESAASIEQLAPELFDTVAL